METFVFDREGVERIVDVVREVESKAGGGVYQGGGGSAPRGRYIIPVLISGAQSTTTLLWPGKFRCIRPDLTNPAQTSRYINLTAAGQDCWLDIGTNPGVEVPALFVAIEPSGGLPIFMADGGGLGVGKASVAKLTENAVPDSGAGRTASSGGTWSDVSGLTYTNAIVPVESDGAAFVPKPTATCLLWRGVTTFECLPIQSADRVSGTYYAGYVSIGNQHWSGSKSSDTAFEAAPAVGVSSSAVISWGTEDGTNTDGMGDYIGAGEANETGSLTLAATVTWAGTDLGGGLAGTYNPVAALQLAKDGVVRLANYGGPHMGFRIPGYGHYWVGGAMGISASIIVKIPGPLGTETATLDFKGGVLIYYSVASSGPSSGSGGGSGGSGTGDPCGIPDGTTITLVVSGTGTGADDGTYSGAWSTLTNSAGLTGGPGGAVTFQYASGAWIVTNGAGGFVTVICGPPLSGTAYTGPFGSGSYVISASW